MTPFSGLSRRIGTCVLLATLGCSSSPGSSSASRMATSSGTVGNETFAPASAIAQYHSGMSASGPYQFLAINVSTRLNTCSQGGDANASELDISLPAGDPPAKGQASVVANGTSGGQASAVFGIYSTNTTDFYSESGSVTIESISSSAVSGSFAITFGQGHSSTGSTPQAGGTLTGTFTAVICQ